MRIYLEQEVEKILEEYIGEIEEAAEDGMAAAEKVLIKRLAAASPKGITKQYRKSWKGSGDQYKLFRFVGNTKAVKGGKKKRGRKRGSQLPLSDILEYSTVRGHPFIKRTFENSVDEMVNAMTEAMKRRLNGG